MEGDFNTFARSSTSIREQRGLGEIPPASVAGRVLRQINWSRIQNDTVEIVGVCESAGVLHRHRGEVGSQVRQRYSRVSTTKQVLSREAQTETVQCAAEYHAGGTAHEIFFDDDTSGSIPFAARHSGRLLLVAVKAALAAGGSPTIIITKVDRLGRDTAYVSQTVSLFESLGARIVLLDITVDTRIAMGRAFMQIAAAFAEL